MSSYDGGPFQEGVRLVTQNFLVSIHRRHHIPGRSTAAHCILLALPGYQSTAVVASSSRNLLIILRRATEMDVTMIGLQNAGKTSLLRVLSVSSRS